MNSHLRATETTVTIEYRRTWQPKINIITSTNATAVKWHCSCTSRHCICPQIALQSRPCNIRMVFASTRPDTFIEKLAQIADKIVEVATPSVSTVTTTPPHITAVIVQLHLEVVHLTNLVKSHTQRCCSPSSNHHRRQSSTDVLYWYHQCFGDSAHNCIEPCSK